eukprot:6803457-Prymnesium_polylepis.1
MTTAALASTWRAGALRRDQRGPVRRRGVRRVPQGGGARKGGPHLLRPLQQGLPPRVPRAKGEHLP